MNKIKSTLGGLCATFVLNGIALPANAENNTFMKSCNYLTSVSHKSRNVSSNGTDSFNGSITDIFAMANCGKKDEEKYGASFWTGYNHKKNEFNEIDLALRYTTPLRDNFQGLFTLEHWKYKGGRDNVFTATITYTGSVFDVSAKFTQILQMQVKQEGQELTLGLFTKPYNFGEGYNVQGYLKATEDKGYYRTTGYTNTNLGFTLNKKIGETTIGLNLDQNFVNTKVVKGNEKLKPSAKLSIIHTF